MTGAARLQDVRMTRGGDKAALALRPAESGESLALAEIAKTLDANPQTFVSVSPKADKPICGAFELIEPITSAGDKPVQLEVVSAAAFGSGPMLWRVAVTDAEADLLVPESIRAIAQADLTKRTPAD